MSKWLWKTLKKGRCTFFSDDIQAVQRGKGGRHQAPSIHVIFAPATFMTNLGALCKAALTSDSKQHNYNGLTNTSLLYHLL